MCSFNVPNSSTKMSFLQSQIGWCRQKKLEGKYPLGYTVSTVIEERPMRFSMPTSRAQARQAPITVPFSYFIAERELRESLERCLGRQIDVMDFELSAGHWCIRVGNTLRPVTEFLRDKARQ